MNFNIDKVKIVVTVPPSNVDELRQAICALGAGKIGNYSCCTTSTNCLGTFIPNENANPYIGDKQKLEFIEEVKLEVICNVNLVKEVLIKLREVHPYEEPEIDIIPLINENNFIYE